MPKILERLVSQIEAQGVPKAKAYAVATSQLQAHGILKKGTVELTTKGEVRNEMTASERAKDRASKASGRPVGDLKYSPKTNRATVKKSAK